MNVGFGGDQPVHRAAGCGHRKQSCGKYNLRSSCHMGAWRVSESGLTFKLSAGLAPTGALRSGHSFQWQSIGDILPEGGKAARHPVALVADVKSLNASEVG